MADRQADVVVIGSGPGGYVAAIRAAQLGQKTIVIERDNVGGVCLNWGCIPSKALIHAGHLAQQMRHAAELGISGGGEVSVDLKQLVSWKDKVVGRLTGGVDHLLKGNQVEFISGEATLLDARTVDVGGERIHTRGIILATGSTPIELPGFEFDGKQLLSSRQILGLDQVPKRLAIIGGGVIGLELGMFFQNVGSQLTVIELLDQLLPGTDPELVKVVTRTLKKAKTAIHLKSKATAVKKTSKGVELTIEGPKGEQTVTADAVLVCVGRRPNSRGLGLADAGVMLDARGYVQVNKRLETTASGVFAIGDLNGPPFLAHKASKEGMIAAEALCGKRVSWDVRAMPSAIFTDPEIATVGQSEAEAIAAGHEVSVGRFPFSASGRAMSTGETAGFVKIIGDKATGQLLGCGIVGADASNLIGEAALALELGASVEDIALTVHAHPTLTESLMEACEDSLGHAIHVLSK